MVSFTGLPPEIQPNVLKNLNYPDLTRMRMTHTYFRDLATRTMVRQALIRLEEDWKLFKSDTLITWRQLGYNCEDTNKMTKMVPCYTCLQVKPSKDIPNDPVNFPTRLAYYSSPLMQVSNGARECIGCLLQRIDLSAEPGRSVKTEKYRVVDCQNCGLVKMGKVKVSRRQKNAEQCDDCFALEDQCWEVFKLHLKQKKTEFTRYLNWMKEFEKGSNAATPPMPGPFQPVYFRFCW